MPAPWWLAGEVAGLASHGVAFQGPLHLIRVQRHGLAEFISRLARYHDGSETDVVGRTTKQESSAGRWLFGAAHVVCELVHRLVVGRIGGMPMPQEGNFPV
jgi:hypothetical protein